MDVPFSNTSKEQSETMNPLVLLKEEPFYELSPGDHNIKEEPVDITPEDEVGNAVIVHKIDEKGELEEPQFVNIKEECYFGSISEEEDIFQTSTDGYFAPQEEVEELMRREIKTESDTREEVQNNGYNIEIQGQKTSLDHGTLVRPKYFGCETCGKNFISYSYLQDHKNIHSGKKPFQCTVCGKAFHGKRNLAVHLSKLCDKPTHKQCTPMKVSASNSRVKNKKQQDRETRIFECRLCGKHLSSKTNLNHHLRTHSGGKPHKCTQCDQAFFSRSNLAMHVRIHTGEKPFTCNLCNKTFARNGGLIIHMKSHTGEKPFKCDQCDKGFGYQWHLKRHMKICADM